MTKYAVASHRICFTSAAELDGKIYRFLSSCFSLKDSSNRCTATNTVSEPIFQDYIDHDAIELSKLLIMFCSKTQA